MKRTSLTSIAPMMRQRPRVLDATEAELETRIGVVAAADAVAVDQAVAEVRAVVASE
jgi:hypothetical protein